MRVPTRRSSRARGGGRAVAVFLALSAAACSVIGGRPASTGPSPYRSGVTSLAQGDFAGADSLFRASAARCESGREGRRALLFLSLLAQDPRNPDAQADTAALMAARFLYLPDGTPEEDLEAEALYVSALDRGANPGLRPDPRAPGLASRFDHCDVPAWTEPLTLPVLDRPTSLLLLELEADRKALRERNATLTRTVDELQAELERIRRLLQLPDTGSIPPPMSR